MSIKLSVVIPMYNEEKICAQTAERLDSYLASVITDGEYEVVFANDGSRDQCGEIIHEIGQKNGRIRLVGYPDNHGKGCAIRTGVLAAQGDFILYTDCDLAYGTEIIGTMYKTLSESENDLLIGSRNLSKDGYAGYSLLRRMMSKAYLCFLSLATGFSYSDSQCGIKCLRKDTAHELFSQCRIDGFAFDLEMLMLADRAKKKVGEFPAKILDNRESDSRVHPVRDSIRMLKDVHRMKKLHPKKKKNGRSPGIPCPGRREKDRLPCGAGLSFYFGLARNKAAASVPKSSAAVMPPAPPVSPPVRIPIAPCSATALFTPIARQ